MSPDLAPKRTHRYLSAYIAISGLFVIWGIAHWDFIILLPQFVAHFGFGSSPTSAIQVLFQIAYCLFAIPAALIHRQLGYKTGIVFALSMIAVSPWLIYPAIAGHQSFYVLGAIVLLGAGWAALETNLNPLTLEIGSPKTAVRRLNFVQSFYSVGLVAGYYIAQWIDLKNYQNTADFQTQTAARPFIVVGLVVLLLAFCIDRVEFPGTNVKRSKTKVRIQDELRTLLADRMVRYGAVALFFCIAAQSTVMGATWSYVASEIHPYSEVFVSQMMLWSCIVFAIGRVVGTMLMGRVDPIKLLAWGMGFGMILIVAAVATGGIVGVVCLIGTNLFLSIGYPTVFGTTLTLQSPVSKIASGLLVAAAGLAATISPPVMNLAMKASSPRMVILLAIPCFIAIMAYTRSVRRMKRPTLSTQDAGVRAPAAVL